MLKRTDFLDSYSNFVDIIISRAKKRGGRGEMAFKIVSEHLGGKNKNRYSIICLPLWVSTCFIHMKAACMLSTKKPQARKDAPGTT